MASNLLRDYVAPVKLSVLLQKVYQRTGRIFIAVYVSEFEDEVDESLEFYELPNSSGLTLSGLHKILLYVKDIPENLLRVERGNGSISFSAEDQHFNVLIVVPEGSGLDTSYDLYQKGYLPTKEIDFNTLSSLLSVLKPFAELTPERPQRMIWAYEQYHAKNFFIFIFENVEQIRFWAKSRQIDSRGFSNGELGYENETHFWLESTDTKSRFFLFGFTVKELLESEIPIYHESAFSATDDFEEVVTITRVRDRNIFGLIGPKGQKVIYLTDEDLSFEELVDTLNELELDVNVSQDDYILVDLPEENYVRSQKRRL